MFTVTPVDTTEICELRRERDKALANYQFMVERAAYEKLDGYRELGARAAQAENERDLALKAAADARLAFEALEERIQAISEEAILAQVASELCDKVDEAMVSRRSGDDLGEHAAWLEGEVVRLTKECARAKSALSEIDADLVALTNSGGLESLSRDHLALVMRAQAFARWRKQPEWDERLLALKDTTHGSD